MSPTLSDLPEPEPVLGGGTEPEEGEQREPLRVLARRQRVILDGSYSCQVEVDEVSRTADKEGEKDDERRGQQQPSQRQQHVECFPPAVDHSALSPVAEVGPGSYEYGGAVMDTTAPGGPEAAIHCGGERSSTTGAGGGGGGGGEGGCRTEAQRPGGCDD